MFMKTGKPYLLMAMNITDYMGRLGIWKEFIGFQDYTLRSLLLLLYWQAVQPFQLPLLRKS